MHGICPKYQRILSSKSPSQRSPSSVPFCIREFTTFKSNSTWSSDQIKLSKLFFFDLDYRSTKFGIFVAARKRINTKFLPIFSQRVMTRVCVSLADTDPCKYTTLHSKALLILFSTSDNTLLNRCFCIYLTSIKSRLCLMHATMISDTPTCHLSVPTYYTSQINYLYFTA